jgi:NADH:ubiquinone oxidoreductase subunit F (NADH-binding)
MHQTAAGTSVFVINGHISRTGGLQFSTPRNIKELLQTCCGMEHKQDLSFAACQVH